ncbi:CDP-glycerol glycerophosphotransferase family protein [Stutzerimonas xanthomarina]|uniref:CDP-glycerol glycerophosphotransferase family protein n=1 Tax=Stutzerimonas xanthomarina TaxID=271420 RepID=UPI003AA91AD8
MGIEYILRGRAFSYFKLHDRKWRSYKIYELISFCAYNILRVIIGRRPINYQRIIEHHYLKSVDCLPVNNRSVFFDSFWGQKIGGDPYAVYRELSRRDEFDIYVWVTRPGCVVPSDVRSSRKVRFVQYNSREYAEALTCCGIFVFNMNLPYYFIKRPGQVLVNTWHGIPLKRLGLDIEQRVGLSANMQRFFNQADILPISGQYEYEKVFKSCGATDSLCGAFLCRGSPRIDLTLNADPMVIRHQLGLNSGKKVVFYAPTWRGTAFSVSAQIDLQLTAISRLTELLGDEYEVFASLHHFTKAAISGRSLGFRQVPEDVDINEFLSVVDVLVSDYSSILIDFLVLDRPIVLHVPDLREYTEDRGLYLDLDDLPCCITVSNDELVEGVKRAPKPSSFACYSKFVQAFIPEQDGASSVRVVDALISKCSSVGVPRLVDPILIYPGALRDNGITSSLKSLVLNLKKRGVDVVLLVDSRHETRVGSFRKNLAYFRRICDVVLVDRGLPGFGRIGYAYAKYLQSPRSLSAEERSELALGVEREVGRVLGDVRFSVAIDFSGYDKYWSLFVSHVNARSRAIYLHSDMWAEASNAKKGHKYLMHIFDLYKKYDFLVSVSSSVKSQNDAQLSRFYGDAVSVSIENCLDLEGIFRKSAAPLGLTSPLVASLPKEVLKFVCLSRLSPEKNIKVAIDAFDRLAHEVNAVLIIAGDGPLNSALHVHAASKVHADRVVFLGHLNNPYPILKAADCLLFPSMYEGQGLALLEALTIGTFCIGSDIPPVREVLEGTGCYIAKANSEQFYLAMRKFSSFKGCVQFSAERYNEKAVSSFLGMLGG